MANSLAVSIYDKSPYFVQSYLFNRYTKALRKSRYSRDFEQKLIELSETERFSRADIEKWQLRKLKSVLTHAESSVPYYKDLFSQIGLKPIDITSIADLEHIPVLTKSKVRDNFDALQSKSQFARPLMAGHTSGTTGTPLDIVYDTTTILATDALDWRQKKWAAISFSDNHAFILGRTIVNPRRKSPPFWQFDQSMKNLWISAFHLTESNTNLIATAILDHSIHSIEGYPSTLSTLAGHLKTQQIQLPMNAAFTSSETLYGWQRELIEDVFECELFDFYGLAERIAFATECASHHRKHLNFEFAINEVTDSQGESLPPGETGYLTGTTLTNFAMPLIRYQTSDITSFDKTPCECGIAMQTMSDIETKAEDLIRTADGKVISPSVLTHPFKIVTSLAKSQIIQTEIDELIIKIVPREEIDSSQLAQLRSSLQDRVGKNMRIKFDVVDQINPGPNAKFRWVISRLES